MSDITFQDEGGIFDLFSGKNRKFTDPFLLPSSNSMPTTLQGALDMCLFLYFMNPQYRRSAMRLIGHFITRIEFKDDDGDKKERDELLDFLRDSLDIYGAMQSMGEEWSAYGNSFFRINFPFDRFLIDRRSGKLKLYALDMFGPNAKYMFDELKYEVPDPTCMKPDGTSEKQIKLDFMDRPSTDLSRVSLRKLDPRRVDLRHSWISGRTRVVWRFEDVLIKEIKDGHIWQVNETPIGMLRAMKDGQDFLFNEDEIFHFKAPTISGISNNGWGVPEIMANYRAIHNVQVYRKIDEAVGLDYMLPFRLFTPGVKSIEGGGQTHDIGMWTSFIEQVIKRRREDLFAMHALPFPTEYQEAGGNGKNLTPTESMQYADNNLMEAMGIPIELWRGTLNIQEIPTTLRLFENTFHFLFRGFDAFLRWAVRRILDQQGREQIGVALILPSMADDLEERNIYLQLAAGGEVSRQKAYRPFGIEDPVQEAKIRMEEDIEIQKEQQKIQADFQRQQQMGSIDQEIAAEQQQSGGGDPSQGAPQGAAGQAPAGSSSTPLDIQQQGQQKAQEWSQITDVGDRRKAMDQVKQSNPNLYDVAKQDLEEMRSQGASQGRKSVTQPQQGQ
jgi:hypothetical protein